MKDQIKPLNTISYKVSQVCTKMYQVRPSNKKRYKHTKNVGLRVKLFYVKKNCNILHWKNGYCGNFTPFFGFKK